MAGSLWLLSWNVNGLRAVLRKKGFSFLNRQETRVSEEQLSAEAHQPLAVRRGMGRAAAPGSPQARSVFGDPNVAHQEREGFGRLLEAGFLDSFREFHMGGGHYTWWSMPTRARDRNVGWRIDYTCVSRSLLSLAPQVSEAGRRPSGRATQRNPRRGSTIP